MSTLPAMAKYIAVAGNMGSGKTSLVEFLCDRYRLRPFYEPHEENPYLADFYGDMGRWAFPCQVHFLTHKLRIHQELEDANRNGRPVLQDRTIYEDAEVFATNLQRLGHLTDRDWATYRELYDTVRRKLQPPDLMIYLRCPVAAIRKRIRQRGREMEQEVPTAYLRRLNKLYESWFERYDLSPVLTLDTGRIDYLTDMVDRIDLFETIEAHL